MCGTSRMCLPECEGANNTDVPGTDHMFPPVGDAGGSKPNALQQVHFIGLEKLYSLSVNFLSTSCRSRGQRLPGRRSISEPRPREHGPGTCGHQEAAAVPHGPAGQPQQGHVQYVKLRTFSRPVNTTLS